MFTGLAKRIDKNQRKQAALRDYYELKNRRRFLQSKHGAGMDEPGELDELSRAIPAARFDLMNVYGVDPDR